MEVEYIRTGSGAVVDRDGLLDEPWCAERATVLIDLSAVAPMQEWAKPTTSVSHSVIRAFQYPR